MAVVELLTVEDSFEIPGRGVVVVPDFSVPQGWKNRIAPIVLRLPDGRENATNAAFNLTHFNISDPTVPVDMRWRIVLVLLDWKNGKLPFGSRIFSSEEIREALFDGSTS